MVDAYDLTPSIPSCPYIAPLMVYFKVMEQLEVSDIYNQGDNILEETVSFMKKSCLYICNLPSNYEFVSI